MWNSIKRAANAAHGYANSRKDAASKSDSKRSRQRNPDTDDEQPRGGAATAGAAPSPNHGQQRRRSKRENVRRKRAGNEEGRSQYYRTSGGGGCHSKQHVLNAKRRKSPRHPASRSNRHSNPRSSVKRRQQQQQQRGHHTHRHQPRHMPANKQEVVNPQNAINRDREERSRELMTNFAIEPKISMHTRCTAWLNQIPDAPRWSKKVTQSEVNAGNTSPDDDDDEDDEGGYYHTPGPDAAARATPAPKRRQAAPGDNCRLSRVLDELYRDQEAASVAAMRTRERLRQTRSAGDSRSSSSSSSGARSVGGAGERTHPHCTSRPYKCHRRENATCGRRTNHIGCSKADGCQCVRNCPTIKNDKAMEALIRSKMLHPPEPKELCPAFLNKLRAEARKSDKACIDLTCGLCNLCRLIYSPGRIKQTRRIHTKFLYSKKHRSGNFLSLTRERASLTWAVVQAIKLLEHNERAYPLKILNRMRDELKYPNLTLLDLKAALEWMKSKKIIYSKTIDGVASYRTKKGVVNFKACMRHCQRRYSRGKLKAARMIYSNKVRERVSILSHLKSQKFPTFQNYRADESVII